MIEPWIWLMRGSAAVGITLGLSEAARVLSSGGWPIYALSSAWWALMFLVYVRAAKESA